MQRLTRSLGSFAWAGSLLAVRGATDLAAGWLPGAEAVRGRERFEHLAWEVAHHLDGSLLELYQAGDALQRDGANLLLPESPWDAAGWLRVMADSGIMAGRSLRFITPTTAGVDAWGELSNKLEVYRLVKEVAEKIGIPPAGRPFGLLELVGRAYELDDYVALWGLEGLGHDYAAHRWSTDEPAPEGLLTTGAAADLPAPSLTMLHAGIGLTFAERLLAQLPPGVPAKDTADTVAEILRLCRASSRPGYEGAAIESMGLVARTFHGSRTDELDRALRGLGEEEARGFFWHGVGRALYFLPINFLPLGDTTWRPFEMALAEALDPVARDNAFSGLGWAFTLVNMRQPDLMARLLLSSHGGRLEREAGFANGVASSVLMRTDTTPDSPLLEAFLGHRPETAGECWERLVVAPCRHALEDVYPRLRRQGRLGEIFRRQPWIGPAGTGPACRGGTA